MYDYKPTLNQRSFDVVIRKKSPNEHLTATSQLFRLSAIFTKGLSFHDFLYASLEDV